MYKTIFFISFITCLLSCSSNQTSKELNEYLKNFDVDINTYNVVCIVPADGCRSCYMPAIEYASKGKSNFLLVLTSNFQKTIDLLIETNPKILKSRIVMDSDNLAIKSGLIFVTSPCIYILKNGKVENKIDLSKYNEQDQIFKEVDQYLSI